MYNYFQAMDFLTKMNNEGVIEFQPELFLTKPKPKLSSEIKANKIEDNKDTASKEAQPKQTKNYQCYVCGEINEEQSYILNHIQEKHNFSKPSSTMYGNPRNYQCLVCQLMFSSNGALGKKNCNRIAVKLCIKMSIKLFSF